MQCSEVSASSPSMIQNKKTSAVPSSPKRRRSTSDVWDHFNARIKINGRDRATCKHCRKDFSASSKNGTTNLKNHLSRCSARKNGESYKEIISFNETDDLENQTVINGNPVFDEERSGLDMVRMIIKHGYPLNMVEHEYFKNFVKNLQPRFKLHSQDTLKADILRVYREEKEKVCKHFDMLSCRFSLILNFWTCHRKKNKYCCFTLQFIEDGHGQKLKKKILALKNVEYDYTGRALFEIVRDIVNLLVRDGLDEIDDILHKIGKAINYISETTIGKQKFQEVVKQLNLRDKDITSQGFPISWDSTFFMLQSALEFREAFSHLQSTDCHFPIELSVEEWEMAKFMHKCLNVFYDVVRKFMESKGPTTDVYFGKIFDIHHCLLQWQKSEHPFIHSIAKKMRATYDKYFGYCTFVSGIAAVFDPRSKLGFVHFLFKELHGSCGKNYLAEIVDALGHIFDEYAKDLSSQALSSSFINNGNSSTSYEDNDCDIRDRWYKSKRGINNVPLQRGELDQYLEEEPISDSGGEFDILAFNGLDSDIIEALKHASSSIASRKLMLSNPSSTSCTEPLPSGFVIKSSDHGSSSNDAEGVRSLIRTKEIQFNEKLAAEKVAREMERIEYEAQLAAKEAQHRQDREQYAEEKFQLEHRIMQLELERQKLLFEANTERQRNLHVPLNYGYPIPSLAPSGAASQSGASNPPGSWYEGSYHHLDTISDISYCPGLLYDYQDSNF
ncbi:zinc finger BED domain-containing protein RICESLEEPER 2-like [Fagus crenata]